MEQIPTKPNPEDKPREAIIPSGLIYNDTMTLGLAIGSQSTWKKDSGEKSPRLLRKPQKTTDVLEKVLPTIPPWVLVDAIGINQPNSPDQDSVEVKVMTSSPTQVRRRPSDDDHDISTDPSHPQNETQPNAISEKLIYSEAMTLGLAIGSKVGSTWKDEGEKSPRLLRKPQKTSDILEKVLPTIPPWVIPDTIGINQPPPQSPPLPDSPPSSPSTALATASSSTPASPSSPPPASSPLSAGWVPQIQIQTKSPSPSSPSSSSSPSSPLTPPFSSTEPPSRRYPKFTYANCPASSSCEQLAAKLVDVVRTGARSTSKKSLPPTIQHAFRNIKRKASSSCGKKSTPISSEPNFEIVTPVLVIGPEPVTPVLVIGPEPTTPISNSSGMIKSDISAGKYHSRVVVTQVERLDDFLVMEEEEHEHEHEVEDDDEEDTEKDIWISDDTLSLSTSGSSNAYSSPEDSGPVSPSEHEERRGRSISNARNLSIKVNTAPPYTNPSAFAPNNNNNNNSDPDPDSEESQYLLLSNQRPLPTPPGPPGLTHKPTQLILTLPPVRSSSLSSLSTPSPMRNTTMDHGSRDRDLPALPSSRFSDWSSETSETSETS